MLCFGDAFTVAKSMVALTSEFNLAANVLAAEAAAAAEFLIEFFRAVIALLSDGLWPGAVVDVDDADDGFLAIGSMRAVVAVAVVRDCADDVKAFLPDAGVRGKAVVLAAAAVFVDDAVTIVLVVDAVEPLDLLLFAAVVLLKVVDVTVTVAVDVMPMLLSQTFDGGRLRALLLTFGNICRMSTSGSLINAAISTWACLVASSAPLIVIERSD